MRVTNGMIRNTTLNGLYSNMNALNKTYAQMATGKKIQTVSDDPIIAGRALKLTTTVLETTQYQSNVKEANSWMEITDSALDNMKEVLKSIRDKCVQGANGTLQKENKQSIKTDIAQLWQQLKKDANATYGGRYVFSGYKTNEPLFLSQKVELEKEVETAGNISVGDDSTIAADSVLKDGTILGQGSQLGKGTIVSKGSIIGAETNLTEADAEEIIGGGFTLTDGSYTYDAEYELEADMIMSKAAKDALVGKAQIDGVVIDETKFEEIKDANGNTMYKLLDDVTIPVNTQFNNDISKELTGHEYHAANGYTTTKAHVSQADCTLDQNTTVGATTTLKGETIVTAGTTLTVNSMIASGSTLKAGSTLGKDSTNPAVLGYIDGHEMQYEIGVNSTITVNSEGMDGIFETMSQCLNEIFNQIDASLVDSSITVADLNQMFTDKLDELDSIINSISEKTSDLGSRMKRTEYVESRLNDQKTTFSSLLSETEDVDVEEVYTNFNVQYATYQSALQATSKIITNTLADYL